MDYRDLQVGKSAARFWYRARRGLLERMVARAVGSAAKIPSRILVIGCGTGSDLGVLSSHGRVWAMDCDRRAIALVEPILVSQKKVADACALPYREGQFDVVVAFEVLEHLADDARAVAEAWRVLRPGGTLLVTVPACAALFSAHDRALGHHRRYCRSRIKRLLAGFGEVRIHYWNWTLFPVIALVRLARRRASVRVESGAFPGPLDRLLGGILNLENRCLVRGWSPPFGLSLVACGRR